MTYADDFRWRAVVLVPKERTIRRWYALVLKQGTVNDSCEQQQHTRWPANESASVEKYVQDHPTFYFEELREYIMKNFPTLPNVSPSTLCRVLNFDLNHFHTCRLAIETLWTRDQIGGEQLTILKGRKHGDDMSKERGSMESIVVDSSGKRLEPQGIGDNAMDVKSGLKQVDNNYGGQAKGKPASTRQKQQAATEIQWTTVGKADKSSAAREKKTAVPTKQSARKLSPQRKRQSDYSADKQRKNNGRNRRGADQGDGEVVFKQLRSYLLNDAPAEYVFHLVQRLNELARARRF
ncbi:hypothetical protein PF005_g2819 [Phytophthora fragariae]|uniref:Uncharacterized protein n=2 Tax=Phytophthora fragariae TaxID=53985 RepID=A0A6A3KL51_9STRA|nr:hypothetical protein PF011_g10997 [Phytophthora fragariae]KAE9232230.1 hypothetical protein PF005_g2819 [Phytophthora fragariae]KAE9251751.1 hypothetical protein PF004_g2315 [Phytophthora fragariae]